MSYSSKENPHVRPPYSLCQVIIHSYGPKKGKIVDLAHSKTREESTRLKPISDIVLNPS